MTDLSNLWSNLEVDREKLASKKVTGTRFASTLQFRKNVQRSGASRTAQQRQPPRISQNHRSHGFGNKSVVFRPPQKIVVDWKIPTQQQKVEHTQATSAATSQNKTWKAAKAQNTNISAPPGFENTWLNTFKAPENSWTNTFKAPFAPVEQQKSEKLFKPVPKEKSFFNLQQESIKVETTTLRRGPTYADYANEFLATKTQALRIEEKVEALPGRSETPPNNTRGSFMMKYKVRRLNSENVVEYDIYENDSLVDLLDKLQADSIKDGNAMSDSLLLEIFKNLYKKREYYLGRSKEKE